MASSRRRWLILLLAAINVRTGFVASLRFWRMACCSVPQPVRVDQAPAVTVISYVAPLSPNRGQASEAVDQRQSRQFKLFAAWPPPAPHPALRGSDVGDGLGPELRGELTRPMMGTLGNGCPSKPGATKLSSAQLVGSALRRGLPVATCLTH